GVLEIFQRSPFNLSQDWASYLETLAGQAAIVIDNSLLWEDAQHSRVEVMTTYDATLEGWSRALDLRDEGTTGHTRRVTDLTIQLAKFLDIGDEEILQIKRGSLLHDIGKIGISDAILLKSGALTASEWEVMRKHPVYAHEWLYPIPYLRPALDIPYCHHEKWDGSGYPRGLAGERIPFAARIFSIVDVWDAPDIQPALSSGMAKRKGP
ncbi:MAG: HD domain-containing protein, partial [Anaerolineales bacterium]|nr:HD domain-containing protein [Anaerolineales bacterium]